MSTFDPSVRSSRIFDATVALHDRLSEVAWPVHPTTGAVPTVGVSLDERSAHAESITVLTSEAEESYSEWVSMSSATREESLVVAVTIMTAVPLSFSRIEVVRRLAELSDAAHSVTYDIPTGKPKAIGFANEIATGSVESVSSGLTNTEDRIIGVAQLRFRLKARI